MNNLHKRFNQTSIAHARTLKNSHPMHHMQISTHPEEPLHFLRTSRPTMLHLCGHFSTWKKRSVVDDSAEIYSGWWRGNGNKWKPLFSGYTLLSIHNFGALETGLLWFSRSQKKPTSLFFLLILRELWVKPWVSGLFAEKMAMFL